MNRRFFVGGSGSTVAAALGDISGASRIIQVLGQADSVAPIVLQHWAKCVWSNSQTCQMALGAFGVIGGSVDVDSINKVEFEKTISYALGNQDPGSLGDFSLSDPEYAALKPFVLLREAIKRRPLPGQDSVDTRQIDVYYEALAGLRSSANPEQVRTIAGSDVFRDSIFDSAGHPVSHLSKIHPQDIETGIREVVEMQGLTDEEFSERRVASMQESIRDMIYDLFDAGLIGVTTTSSGIVLTGRSLTEKPNVIPVGLRDREVRCVLDVPHGFNGASRVSVAASKIVDVCIKSPNE